MSVERVLFCTFACCIACGTPATPNSPAVNPTATSSAPAAALTPTATAAPAVPDYVRSAVEAADRSEEDRALDGGRKPDLMLTFFGIRPGMKVGEIAAGRGYTSELLARVVGSSGKVYGVNSPAILERFANGPWSERLAKPALAALGNVVRLDREFDDPFPADVKDLDVVLDILFYHDTVWLGTDREKMNRAVLAALKPGGIYGVIDHSAAAGSGLSAVKTAHRIEESTLRSEIEHAGFRLVEQASFLRNPGDTRDWNDAPSAAGERRGTSDRFVLKFQKP
jgi:predicted methyltransferase